VLYVESWSQRKIFTHLAKGEKHRCLRMQDDQK
jgi:hypothetical protein